MNRVLAASECLRLLRGIRGERKQRSWNKHTLASISWAVEWDGGGKPYSYLQPPSLLTTHSPTRVPPQPSYPIISILARRIKGTPPLPPHRGKTSPSQLRLTKSDGCLIVRDTDRGLSLSNLKQIASPWGGDYWTSRDDKARTVEPSRGWRWREVKLVDSMWAHVFLRFSVVYGQATRRLGLGLRVSNARTREWQSTTRARDQANAHNKKNRVSCPLKPPP